MTCTNPFRMKNPKQQDQILELPCGHCMACRIARSREWASRIIHEMVYYEKTCFLTLTYDEVHKPQDQSIHKADLQKFFKRLRRDIEPAKIRYFASGEYGDTSGRPHYHAIIFGLGCSETDRKLYQDNWPYGFIYTGTVTYQSARYVAEYVLKKYDGKLAVSEYGDREIPFCLMSKGIGKQFVLDNQDYLEQNQGFTVQGAKVGLPRYYQSKMTGLDKQQIRQLAIENAKKVVERFTERGQLDKSDFQTSLLDLKKASREQAELTLNAKNRLFKKKI